MRIAKPMRVGDCGELTRDDLERLREPRTVPKTKKMRIAHHQVAMALAFGCTNIEAAQLTGYTPQRITGLLADPAFKMLVEHYAGKVSDNNIKLLNDAFAQKIRLMNAGTRHLERHVEDADERDEPLPFRQALQLHDTMADRTGFGKHTHQHNYNQNYASTLEERIRKVNSSAQDADSEPSSETKVVPLLIPRRF